MNGRIDNSTVAETQLNVMAAIQGAGNMTGALMEVMTGMVVFALRGARPPGEVIQQAAVGTLTGAVLGVSDIGGEPGSVSRPIMTGVLRGIGKVGQVTADLTVECADTLVRETYVVRGDVARAAKGAVEGAVDAAREAGQSIEDAAIAASAGALRGATAIGRTASREVKRMLTGSVAGVILTAGSPQR